VSKLLYTWEDLERIHAMKARGWTWPAIAARMNRTQGSVEVTYSRWKNGTHRKSWNRPTRVARMIQMAEAGISSREIANAMGISIQNACVSLARVGYDAEVRRLYRDNPLSVLPARRS